VGGRRGLMIQSWARKISKELSLHSQEQ